MVEYRSNKHCGIVALDSLVGPPDFDWPSFVDLADNYEQRRGDKDDQYYFELFRGLRLYDVIVEVTPIFFEN